MKRLIFILLLALLPQVGTTLRAEVFPGLSLAGTGEIRYLGIFKVYEAMLFLPGEIQRSEVLSRNHSKCLKLEYHVGLTASDIILAAETILDKQHPELKIYRFQEELSRLHGSYTDVREGDSYTLCYDSSTRQTKLSYNDQPVLSIDSAEFAQLYLGIWLSDSRPLDAALREQLLAGLEGE